MTRMTPSEAFVETLAAHGIETVFGIVGSAYMDALDIFEPAGIRFISVAHEQNAAHMADGYARVLDRHGACIAQNGPGITNFVTGIAAAYWAHSPVVCITPETGSATIGMGGFQETEQLPIFSKITKFQVHVNRPDRIAELTSRACDLALAERGPVQINIPRDYFYGEIDVDLPRPVPIERSAGGPESLAAATEALKSAKFPVIVAGGGVIFSHGQDEAVALAERLGAPVVASYLHNDSFPNRHELFCGPLGYQGSKAAMRILQQADVVLALGTRLGPFGTLPQYGIEYWPKAARIVQVDPDHRDDRAHQEDRRRRGGRCPRGRGRAADAPPEPAARRAGEPQRAARRGPAPEGRLGGGARRHVVGRGLARGAAPRAARAREGDAEERDGHDRHRQRLLGRQQLPALRPGPTASSPR